MNVLLIALGVFGALVALLVIIVGIAGSTFAREDRGLGFGGLVITIVGLVLVPISFKVTIAGARGYGTDACEGFADQTGYTTRYITTTTWDTGECFVDSNGSWVPKDQLWLEVGRA